MSVNALDLMVLMYASGALVGAQKEDIDTSESFLLEQNLVTVSEDNKLHLTERGQVFMEKLLSTEFPHARIVYDYPEETESDYDDC